MPTAAFLTLNGVVLLVGERLRQRADARPVGRMHTPTRGATAGGARPVRHCWPTDGWRSCRSDAPC